MEGISKKEVGNENLNLDLFFVKHRIEELEAKLKWYEGSLEGRGIISEDIGTLKIREKKLLESLAV